MDEDSISLKLEGRTPPPSSDQDEMPDQMRSSPIQFSVHNVCQGLSSDVHPLHLPLHNDTANNQKGQKEVKAEEAKEAKIFHELTEGNADEHSAHRTSPGSTVMHPDTPTSGSATSNINTKQHQGSVKREGQEDESEILDTAMLLMGLSRGPSPTPDTRNTLFKSLDLMPQKTAHRPLSAPPENFALSNLPLSPSLRTTAANPALPRLQVLNSFRNAADGEILGTGNTENSRKDALSVLTDATELESSAQAQARDDDDSSDSSHSQSVDALNSKKRRHRTSTEQRLQLEKVFAATSTPSLSVREQLASQLGMSPRRVQIWFQNKRAKVKRAHNRAYRQVSLSPKPSVQSQPALPLGTGALVQQGLAQPALPQFQQPFTIAGISGITQPLQPLQQTFQQGLQQLPQLSAQFLHLSPQLGQQLSPTPSAQLSAQLFQPLSPPLSPNGQPQQLLSLASGQPPASLVAPLGLPVQSQLPPLNVPIASSAQGTVNASLPLPQISGAEKL